MAKDALPTADEEWAIIGQTAKSSFEKEGLTPGGKYYFRVAAITSNGMTDYTDLVAKIVV